MYLDTFCDHCTLKTNKKKKIPQRTFRSNNTCCSTAETLTLEFNEPIAHTSFHLPLKPSTSRSLFYSTKHRQNRAIYLDRFGSLVAANYLRATIELYEKKREKEKEKERGGKSCRNREGGFSSVAETIR